MNPRHHAPRRLRSLIAGVAAGTLLGLCGLASAQDVKDRTIKFAFVNTADSAHGLGANKLVEAVSQKSGGKLKWDPLESTCRHASLSIL